MELGERTRRRVKTKAFAGVWVALAVAIQCASGCAESNDIPVEVVQGDAGKRDVITNDPGEAGSIKAYDAAGLFDGDEPSSKDGGGTGNDSSTSVSTCTFQPNAQGGMCSSAIDLGSVSGDSNPSLNTLTYIGKGSQWLVFTATEDVHGLTNKDLSVKLTLTSPSGSNYDLYGFVDANGTTTTRACNTASGQSNNAAGMNDEVTLMWDDTKLSTDSDNTRMVSVKVEYISGPCGATDEWTLTVEGHPQ